MKWEYIVQVLPEMSPQDSLLNSLGGEGWELVSVVAYEGMRVAYLKRPITEELEQAMRRALVRDFMKAVR